MRSLFLPIATASLAALLSGCESSIVVEPVDVEPVDATLTVANESSYVIEEIHLTSVHSSSWGPNLIPAAMFPGESVVIVDIACGRYDVLVSDETGLDCILGDLSLCFADHEWIIEDSTLDACAFGKRYGS